MVKKADVPVKKTVKPKRKVVRRVNKKFKVTPPLKPAQPIIINNIIGKNTRYLNDRPKPPYYYVSSSQNTQSRTAQTNRSIQTETIAQAEYMERSTQTNDLPEIIDVMDRETQTDSPPTTDARQSAPDYFHVAIDIDADQDPAFDYNSMPQRRLRQILKDRKMMTGGNKQTNISDLELDDAARASNTRYYERMTNEGLREIMLEQNQDPMEQSRAQMLLFLES